MSAPLSLNKIPPEAFTLSLKRTPPEAFHTSRSAFPNIPKGTKSPALEAHPCTPKVPLSSWKLSCSAPVAVPGEHSRYQLGGTHVGEPHAPPRGC